MHPLVTAYKWTESTAASRRRPPAPRRHRLMLAVRLLRDVIRRRPSPTVVPYAPERAHSPGR